MIVNKTSGLESEILRSILKSSYDKTSSHHVSFKSNTQELFPSNKQKTQVEAKTILEILEILQKYWILEVSSYSLSSIS